MKPGDTITYTLTVTGKRALASRPGWGLLFSHSTGVNQDGDEVFAFDGKVMTPVRPVLRLMPLEAHQRVHLHALGLELRSAAQFRQVDHEGGCYHFAA